MRTVIDQHEDLLTVAEVARLLRVASSTVRKWIGREQIPYLALPSGDYRIPRVALFRSCPQTWTPQRCSLVWSSGSRRSPRMSWPQRLERSERLDGARDRAASLPS